MSLLNTCSTKKEADTLLIFHEHVFQIVGKITIMTSDIDLFKYCPVGYKYPLLRSKCRIILETEELAQSLRKKNIEKAEINRRENRTEQSRMRRNKTKQKPKQNEPEKQPETTEN